ncbi:hypothetical protein BABINDRAFT_160385 [Babjeviella inositovora NRRL Y-12698]|uniref:Protein SYM1 n=1 Tax=Babjeviella inositovora NRRL Y-12698 TaxID=984486 RepID=A0A1E3QTF6_9ASCO|nr:uncharacterized protein BABINDRAFT_160385 [Babjeviella inositovora NRRL Y-12698]ODQ80948.1 hypothetical protein BABINDRAFT_160385 [Babjeviella inositovora NRRL Y-12698]
MFRLFSLYKDSFQRRPLLTNIISTGLLSGIGDTMAQKLFPAETGKQTEFDYGRLLRVMFYGGLIYAPIADKWFRALAKISIPTSSLFAMGLKQTSMGIAAAGAVARVMIDQLCFRPVSVAMYYLTLTLLEQKSMNEVQEKLKLNYWPTLFSCWTIWPAIQLLNFSFVKVQYRLVVVSTVSLAWNCYLSYMNSQKVPKLNIEFEVTPDSTSAVIIHDHTSQ